MSLKKEMGVGIDYRVYIPKTIEHQVRHGILPVDWGLGSEAKAAKKPTDQQETT